MKFLCINTASAKIAVALYSNGEVLIREDTEFKKASAVTLVFIDELLSKAQLKISDLDFIAVVTGPGSFTGIRIGLSTAKAFSFVTGVKLVPVTLHEVLSYNKFSAVRDKIVTLSDAANNLTYATVYNKNKSVLSETAAYTRDGLNLFLKAHGDGAVCTEEDMTADGLVSAAKEKYEKTGAVTLDLLEPLYIRKPQAEES
jgi:tRNA threonylcarbamoyl adenosine modification protein YeaZ